MNNKEKNDLLYLCSLIEYIGRKTKNHRGDVVRQIGKKELERLYKVAEINHCLTFEEVSDEVITDCKIKNGVFDTVSSCLYNVPSFIAIASDYARLIEDVNTNNLIDTLYLVYTSFISDEISNFNSDFYYQNRSYLKACYLEGKVLLE